MMLKSFDRIQVKIYCSSTGGSIFLSAQFMPCDELPFPLIQFYQAHSGIQLCLVKDSLSEKKPLSKALHWEERCESHMLVLDLRRLAKHTVD